MKFTKVRPTKIGVQFVATWIHGDRVWCSTFKNTQDGLKEYNVMVDAFVRYPKHNGSSAPFPTDAKYVVL